jgi:hypothetical protein
MDMAEDMVDGEGVEVEGVEVEGVDGEAVDMVEVMVDTVEVK